MDVSHCAELWYAAKEQEVKHATYRSYGNTLRRLVKRFGPERITDITPDELNAYIRGFEKQGYRRDTVQLEIFHFADGVRLWDQPPNGERAGDQSGGGPSQVQGAALSQTGRPDRGAGGAGTEGGGRSDRGLVAAGLFPHVLRLSQGEALALSYSDIDRKRGVITDRTKS